MPIDIVAITSKGEDVLKEFVVKLGLEGALIASADGLELVSYFTTERDADMLAADAASAITSIAAMLDATDKGKLVETVVHGEKGYIAIVSLSEDAVLAVLAPPTQKLGVVLAGLKQLVQKLNQLK